MLDEHGHGQAEAHDGEAETRLHTQGDGHEDHGADGLALEDQARIHHQEGEDDIQHPEWGIGSDAEAVESGIDHGVGQISGIEARAQGVSTSREQHQMPRDVDVVPFHHADARQKG